MTLRIFDALRVWDVESGKLVRTLFEDNSLQTAVLTADQRRVAVATGRGKVSILDVATGDTVSSFSIPASHFVSEMAFSPDERFLLTGGTDATLRLWDVESGRAVAMANDKTHVFNCIAITSDGGYAVTGGGQFWSDDKRTMVREDDYALRLWRLP